MRYVLFSLLIGCATLRPVNPNHAARKAEVSAKLGVDEQTVNTALQAEQKECDSLDNKYLGWTGTSIVVGVLSGGSGLTSLFTEQTARQVTGGIGIGLAAVSALSAYLSSQFAQRYSRRCTVNTGGK